MDRDARGEKGEEGRERRNRCKKIVDAKMRFAKTGPGFPCAAHANSFTRVPGRNAAGCLRSLTLPSLTHPTAVACLLVCSD